MDTFGLLLFGSWLLAACVAGVAAGVGGRFFWGWVVGLTPTASIALLWCSMLTHSLVTVGPHPGNSDGNPPDSVAEVWSFGAIWIAFAAAAAFVGASVVWFARRLIVRLVRPFVR